MAGPEGPKQWAAVLGSLAAVLAPLAAIVSHLAGAWNLPEFVMRPALDAHESQMRREVSDLIGDLRAELLEREARAAARQAIEKQIASAELALAELPDGPARDAMEETLEDLRGQLDRLDRGP